MSMLFYSILESTVLINILSHYISRNAIVLGFFQAHVVSAFEHSLGNMTSRLEQLNDTSNRKVNIISNLILSK